MSSFRDTALRVVCSQCGARVLVPQLRPGARLRCPKCGAALKLPAGTVPTGKDAAGFLPAQEESHPLGSGPTASLKPAENLGAEIDDLILADVQPTESPPKHAEPKDDGPKYHIPPTELPPPPTMHVGSPQAPRQEDQSATGATPGGSHTSDADDGEYKLANDLGPLPIPAEKLGAASESVVIRKPVAPPLPAPAVPTIGTSGAGEFDLGFDPGLSPSRAPRWQMRRMFAGFRARAASALQGGDGSKSATGKPSKYTPYATLDDPRRAFLRGVFEFLFYLDVLPHWIKLWFSTTLELVFASWILSLIGSGFLEIVVIWLVALASLLGFALVAMTWAVGSAILEDTAAGMSHVENWPESLVLDDFSSLIFPAAALFYSALPSAGINWLAADGMPQIWLLEVAIGLILFPLAILSIMETGSIIQPVSPPVFRCLWDRPGTWFWFYGESSIILALAGWISFLLWRGGGIWRFALAAAISTGAIIIYFRLLGRLGLVCANQAARAILQDDEAADHEAELTEKSAGL